MISASCVRQMQMRQLSTSSSPVVLQEDVGRPFTLPGTPL